MARAWPSHLRGDALPSAAWRAYTHWHNTSHLTAILPPLKVYQLHGYDRSFVFQNGDLRARMGAPRETRLVMPVEELVERSADRSETLYTSVLLKKLGAAVLADIQPLGPYMCVDCETQSSLWIATERGETHAHYDHSHNVFVQVIGRKHITLWPPSVHELLLFHPRLHSLARQSSLSDPLLAAAPPAHEVTLDEGDALYIPPVRRPPCLDEEMHGGAHMRPEHALPVLC